MFGRGSVDFASIEYRNSPIDSFTKITEHWRSPMVKGRKCISRLVDMSPSRYTVDIGLKNALIWLPSSENIPKINSFHASSNFCCLLITFANSLDPDQARLNVGPDQDPNSLAF